MNRENLVDLWGDSRVIRFESEALSDVRIPAAAKDFLIDVGLPWRILGRFTVKVGSSLGDSSEPPKRRIQSADVIPWSNAKALRVGWDYLGDVCLLESGEVWTRHPDPTGEKYVNASVELFVESLYRESRARTEITGRSEEELEEPSKVVQDPDNPMASWSVPIPLAMSEDEADQREAALEAELRELDPSAFRTSDMWWPEVLQPV